MSIHKTSLLSLLKREAEMLENIHYEEKWIEDLSDLKYFKEVAIKERKARISEYNKSLQEVRYNMGLYFSEVLGLRK